MTIKAEITTIVAHPGWFRVTATCSETGLQESDQVEGREVAEHAAAFLKQKLAQALEHAKRKGAR